MIIEWKNDPSFERVMMDATIVVAYGKLWRKVTPRSQRQTRRNILKQFNIDPNMASAVKIQYNKLNDTPDPEHYRIPITSVVAATNKALLVDFGDKKEWMPSSQIIYGVVGRQRVCDMPEWLARKHKLI
jgi:hypothetical protein